VKPTLVVALAVSLGGCRINPVPFGSDSVVGQSNVNRTEFTEKVVNIKRAPVTLVAKDGSRCQVDELTWRDTRVGDKTTCAWEFAGKR
jgi:predicted lipoprotein